MGRKFETSTLTRKKSSKIEFGTINPSKTTQKKWMKMMDRCWTQKKFKQNRRKGNQTKSWGGTIDPWALRFLVVREIDCGDWLARGYMPAHQHCDMFYPLVGDLIGSTIN